MHINIQSRQQLVRTQRLQTYPTLTNHAVHRSTSRFRPVTNAARRGTTQHNAAQHMHQRQTAQKPSQTRLQIKLSRIRPSFRSARPHTLLCILTCPGLHHHVSGCTQSIDQCTRSLTHSFTHSIIIALLRSLYLPVLARHVYYATIYNPLISHSVSHSNVKSNQTESLPAKYASFSTLVPCRTYSCILIYAPCRPTSPIYLCLSILCAC